MLLGKCGSHFRKSEVSVETDRCAHAQLYSAMLPQSRALSTEWIAILLIAIRSQDGERPHCTLKTLPSTHFRYHVTDDGCARVASLLVESVDTATARTKTREEC